MNLTPPYLLALVDVDEGPRLLTNIDAAAASIGDRVIVAWRARDGLPPLPVFTLAIGLNGSNGHPRRLDPHYRRPGCIPDRFA